MDSKWDRGRRPAIGWVREGSESKQIIGIFRFREVKGTKEDHLWYVWFVVPFICMYYHSLFLTIISICKSWVIIWFNPVCWTWRKVEADPGVRGEYIVLQERGLCKVCKWWEALNQEESGTSAGQRVQENLGLKTCPCTKTVDSIL